MDTRRTRRGFVALAASLVVHACVLAWMLNPAPSPPPPRSSTVKLIWLDAPPITKSVPPPPPFVTPSKRRERPINPPRPALPTPRESDSPRAIALTPRGEDAPVVDASLGRTLSPADLPSSDERAAEEQERVSALVGTWLTSDVSAARVRGGLPDPAYGQLGKDLRAATDDVPRFIDTSSPKAVVGALVESWGAGAERYGKTGAPYAEPEGRLENSERPPSLVEAAAKGNPDAQAMVQFFSAGARLQEFADGRAGLELYALVELRQHASGAFESAQLVRPSGLAPFDAWVLERSRQVALSFSLDGGSRARPLRSVWRFDGIIIYRRKLKLSELDGRAALGMITMAALSALSALNHETPDIPGGSTPRPLGPRIPGMLGRFDETTGALDVVDLTNPTYDCTVRLLEAD